MIRAGFPAVLSFVLLTLPLTAQVAIDPSDFEKILFPVAGSRQGAFGSFWLGSSTIRNISEEPIMVSPNLQSPGFCCLPGPVPALPPGRTVAAGVEQAPRDSGSIPHGAFLFVERGRTRDLAVSNRVRSGSRRTGAAIDIPVVFESDLFANAFEVLSVSSDPDTRWTVHVYDWDATPDTVVRILVREHHALDGDTSTIFATAEILIPPAQTDPVTSPSELHISIPVPVRSFDFAYDVRVEIIEGEGRIWGFVSSTHNATQAAAAYVPQSSAPPCE